jgi:hypothetical protein
VGLKFASLLSVTFAENTGLSKPADPGRYFYRGMDDWRHVERSDKDCSDGPVGYVDRSRETVLTLGPSYVGSHLVTVLSEVAPNGAALILLDGAFYQINSVHSSNVLATLITYDCTSLAEYILNRRLS